jgi:hypothetical protein
VGLWSRCLATNTHSETIVFQFPENSVREFFLGPLLSGYEDPTFFTALGLLNLGFLHKNHNYC